MQNRKREGNWKLATAESYIIKCWHCTTEFDAAAAADCSHSAPTKICPFCLKCFCDASEEYKKKFIKNCPKGMLAAYGSPRDTMYLKFGEILVKAGKITLDQLDMALDRQRIVNKKLGEVLIMMSLITPDELQLYLLNQKSIESIDLNQTPLDMNLIHQIGREFCLDQKIVPIEIQEIGGGRVLRFAFYSLPELSKLKKRSELQKYQLIPYLARKEDIENFLKNLENSEKEIKIYTSQESARHVNILNSLVKSAVRSRASDILFECKSGQLGIFFRNGELLSRVSQQLDSPIEFFEKIKEICGFKRREKETLRESWLNLNKNFSHLKIKVLYYPGDAQESIRFRFHNLKDYARKIDALNLDQDEMERMRSMLQKPRGLFIVAGPPYSRIPETLYALMNTLSGEHGERIATVENNVVLRNERFFQIENSGGDVTDAVYKNLLFFKPDSMFLFDYFQKSFNRQFLDFVEMGKLFVEMQGFSYEEIFEKAQVEVEVPQSFLLENLRLVLFQRQVKTLCSACKKPDPRPARQLFKNMNLSGDYQVFQEEGCPECLSSGYGGVETVCEVFTLEDHDRALLRPGHLATLDHKISEAGNLTIAQKVLNRVLKGEVSYKESARFF